MTYNQARNKATQKYHKEHLEIVSLRVRKGERERYKAHATKRGKSLTALIVELLERDIQEHCGEQMEILKSERSKKQ